MKYSICFIGYGEAAYNISKGLESVRHTDMIAFDTDWNSDLRGPMIRERMEEVGVACAKSAEEAVSDARFIMIFTSAASAVSVAKGLIGKLKPGQVYCDCNSAAPTSMEAIDALPRPEGVKFTDVSLMGNVPEDRHLTKMMICGDGGAEFFDFIKDYTPNAKLLDTPVGSASAVKMFKSVFSKGLPQLLIECLVPAMKYGVYDLVYDGFRHTFDKRTLTEFADATVFRTLVHAKRRAAEMRDVESTLNDMHLGSDVSAATAVRLERLAEHGYAAKIGQGTPGLKEVIGMVLEDERA